MHSCDFSRLESLLYGGRCHVGKTCIILCWIPFLCTYKHILSSNMFDDGAESDDRYGAYPLRGKYCHEMALRILLASIEVKIHSPDNCD